MSNKLIDKLLNDRLKCGDAWVTDEDAKAIAALLSAGQEMERELGTFLARKDSDNISDDVRRRLTIKIKEWHVAMREIEG